MSDEYPQTPAELQARLDAKIRSLKRLVDAYDAGDEDVAAEIADALRWLLHDPPPSTRPDARPSRSGLGQLGLKQQSWFDTRIDSPPGLMAGYANLIAIVVGPTAARYVPLLDMPDHQPKFTPFDAWWTAEVLSDASKQRVLTRKRVIKDTADKLGAHLDPELGKLLGPLLKGNPLGLSHITGKPIQNALFATIRQIAHEVLKTLDRSYEKPSPPPSGDEIGFMFPERIDIANVPPTAMCPVHRNTPWAECRERQTGAGMLREWRDEPAMLVTKAMSARIPPRVGTPIKQEDACPCGNGKTFGNCHGVF